MSLSAPTFLESLFAHVVFFATPKKKVTHSKKRLRLAHSGLVIKRNIVTCPVCASEKLMHTICWNCFRNIRHANKEASLN